MNHDQAITILRPQWEGAYWAKSSGEFLWAHQYKVFRVASKLADFMPPNAFSKSERNLLEIACLTHDIGKIRDQCQARLKAGQAPGDHKLKKNELANYLKSVGMNAADKHVQAIWDIARTHHSFTSKDFERQEFSDASKIGQLLIAADWLASMSSPNFATISKLQDFYDGRFGLTVFQISRFPSPTSFRAVEIASKHYRDRGWEPLLVYPNAAIFVSKLDTPYPSRDEISRDIELAVIDGSLALQKPVPTGYTGDFLTLLSKQYPDRLLASNESRIKQELATTNRALVFLKLARDILEIRHDLAASDKENSPLLAIVDSANSTTAHRKAKEKYRKAYGTPVPEKVNNDMFAPAFEKSSLKDVIPEIVATRSGIKLPLKTKLKTVKADDLFDVLVQIAQPIVRDQTDDKTDQQKSGELFDYLRASISMHEEVDFEQLAQKIFDRYKTYKKTSDAEKGVCERCASPVAAKMQKGSNFATKSQAFSQIKPKGNKNRAICPLCGYDNLIVRNGVYEGSSHIFLRVESELPDLVQKFPALQSLVNKICSAVRHPRSIASMQELPKFDGVPFPKRLRIPLADPEKDDSLDQDQIVRVSDRGLLLKVGFVKGAESPRNLRTQYEPLFHVLKFLGFTVGIGTEDQEQLFGMPVVTSAENYKRSLAVVLLASQLEKNNNRLIYASELLKRSPSTALSYAAGDGREKFGLNQKLLVAFIEYLVAENPVVSSRSGDVSMKEILEHAAFLAPSFVGVNEDSSSEEELEVDGEDESKAQKRKRFGGIWTYCEHKRGEKLTKHTATKPISQALEQLMLGRGVDFALNKFMQNLNTRIKNENASELKDFVDGVRKIIVEAERIRKANVTDFLRYKNGLLSAVFMLTRYPDLKDVITTDQ